MEIQVEITLGKEVIHTCVIDVNFDDNLFGSNYFDGLQIRGEVDRHVTSKIKTNWRHMEPHSESDKNFLAIMENSGLVEAVPKSRQPKKGLK